MSLYQIIHHKNNSIGDSVFATNSPAMFHVFQSARRRKGQQLSAITQKIRIGEKVRTHPLRWKKEECSNTHQPQSQYAQ